MIVPTQRQGFLAGAEDNIKTTPNIGSGELQGIDSPTNRPRFWEPTQVVRPAPLPEPPEEKDIPEKEWPLVFERANASMRKAIEEVEMKSKIGGVANP